MKNLHSFIFKAICLLLALNFLPEVAWSAFNAEHECYQMEEKLPEPESESSCTDTSKECAEDTLDSFMHAPESAYSAMRVYTIRLEYQAILSILLKADEVLIPPPRQEINV